MTRNIGGVLRYELFDRQPRQPDPATVHRPTDAAALKREALNLAARGLTARDIAALMQLSEQAVQQLLSTITKGSAL